MNRDDIVKKMGWPCGAYSSMSDIIVRIEKIVAAEREACARLADEIDDMSGREIAANIRKRGQE